MKLNYRLQGNGQPIVFLHGVFGSLDNLNMLAKEFAKHYQTVQVDLRNHGYSPWSDKMDYQVMAEDVAELCHDLKLKEMILIGHSMGGKVALRLSQLLSNDIQKIAAIDIAPIKYYRSANAIILRVLTYCLTNHITDKKQIMDLMKQAGINDAIILFLLKSFKNERWLFNVQAINDQYEHICDWQIISPWLKPTLFIRGGNSTYITDDAYQAIFDQFPNAKIEVVEGAGHNVHAEKAQQVLQLLHNWLGD
ncbi:alpha/beta fold hydrolase [Gilliamella sp. Pas-s27]|uniref:alpha/beta fold hydrolase n=1 Tax=Gilliamella sp. Pas-s27 TaxID=2687311 RepID=UPI001365A4F5|nr:alpha/beta fold hydrolase [Gilliamella sp. Pas-s27]MWP47381.1 alpha/beta fold hydrolase [Gilliamella sp. Pas-s27]